MNTNAPLMLPVPRQFTFDGGETILPQAGLIVIDCPEAHTLAFAARQLQQALREHAGVEWEIVAGTFVPPDQTRVVLSIVPGGVPHEQGYALTITPERIDVVASQPVGVFYGVQSLRQLLRGARSGSGPSRVEVAVLPTLRCVDWPDFPNRGVMLDISRDKVPTMETLVELVDLLASFKVNQLQLYTEHTFAYRNHPLVWAEASPLTGDEILALDAFCKERFIELVPNQNTFGHMTRWLIHEPYQHLAEAPAGSWRPWGVFKEGPYSISPNLPGSLELVRGLLDELLPHFSSRQVNVGCDETFDLDQGLSKALVDEQGEGRVYLDFLLKIYREVKARQRTMQYWGDIIMKYPELVLELPRDAIALEWGYEADHPFDRHGAAFAASGMLFYVCPGTSSWCSVAGRTDNALGNLRNAAANGLTHGAVGFLNTDWGDEGHWQPLPVSYLGFAYGAAVAWGYQANREMDIAAALDAFVFHDEAGEMGRLAHDLGNVYQEIGVFSGNASALFNVLQMTPSKIAGYINPINDKTDLIRRVEATLQRIDEITDCLPKARMRRVDAGLVAAEFAWAADLLRHACRRSLWAVDISRGSENLTVRHQLLADADRLIAEHASIWHARNRSGGFKDSVARFQQMRDDYVIQ